MAETPSDPGVDASARRGAWRVPTRRFGRQRVPLSVIGFGGIVVMGETPARAADLVSRAVELGVNYFDVAPSYGDAEERLGPALEPHRDRVFLACKTLVRDRVGAEREFARSCERLRTDRFDLYQLHALTSVRDDVDAAFARGGVMEWVEQMRRAGRIGHVGFSAHSVEAARAALERYPFDSILFPVSFSTWFRGNFGPQVLQLARERGVSVLALKAFALQQWPEGAEHRGLWPKCWYEPVLDPGLGRLALRFTLNQPGVVAAIPPGDERLFFRACEMALDTPALTAEEESRLKAVAEGLNPLFRFQAEEG